MVSEPYIEEEGESNSDWGDQQTVTGKVAFELRLKGDLGDKERRRLGLGCEGATILKNRDFLL